jgi:hypothetical protein
MTTSKKTVSSTKNTAKKSASKNSPVSSPAIEKAWRELVDISNTGEASAIAATLNLAREMKKSTLTVRQVQAAIKNTGLESPFVKVSHVEGIPTMLAMQKVTGFSALTLAKQLSTAVASYKLLGAGNGEKLLTLTAVEKANAGARKVKHDNAKGEKSPTNKPEKAKATDADTLRAMLGYLEKLNFQSVSEDNRDIITEISTVIESKMLQLA